MADGGRDGRFSRRDFAKGTASAALAGGLLGAVEPHVAAAREGGRREKGRGDPCGDERNFHLENGKFVDYRGVVAKELVIQNGRITSVGKPKGKLAPCTREVNLKGRTVVPGLIDSHVHFARTGTNPGYETRWVETSFSIAELQEEIAKRAKTVPSGPVASGGGGVITASGGWTPLQFAEARLPTLAELDDAAPRHAVYLNGRTNTVGKAFFESRGLTVDPVTGQVSSTGAATTALRSIQTFEDKVRGTRDAIAYAAANGLTGCHDTGNLTTQPDDYAVMNTLYHRDGRSLDVRMRHYRYFGDTVPAELQAYMDPIFKGIGDDIWRINGVGEQIGDMMDFMEQARLVAQAGWRVTQHFDAEHAPDHVVAFHTLGNEFDLRPLRWSFSHAGTLSAEQIQQLISVGVGVTITRGPARTFINSAGLQTGGATDATNVSWLSPWMQMSLFVTRRNQQGALVLDGQQISRLEALRLYTIGSAWFSGEDDELGSFHVGKLADMAVLSDDYLKVPEDRIRKIRSHLTLQGGRVVHAEGRFSDLK
jgi:predicted amidohydrolase YtcJ